MLRQLLTFLALITGLAATSAPAQAHMATAETCMEAAFEIVVMVDKCQQQAALLPVPSARYAAPARADAAIATVPVRAGTRIGIDRARE